MTERDDGGMGYGFDDCDFSEGSMFEEWIRQLDEDVIQGEYGFEPGEFTVYPDHWRQLFNEKLTPAQAYRRALDAFSDERKRRDAEKQANWERIQQSDALIAARKGRS